MASKETDPSGLSAKAPGAKLDSGKSPVFQGVFNYFPRALMSVGDLSGLGAAKYSWGGWVTVSDGVNRYTNALGRHLLKESKGEVIDPETNLMHATAVAWNALARLEMMLREAERPVEIKPYTDYEGVSAKLLKERLKIDGPYCEDCDRLAEWQHPNGTHWCAACAEKKGLIQLFAMGTIG